VEGCICDWVMSASAGAMAVAAQGLFLQSGENRYIPG